MYRTKTRSEHRGHRLYRQRQRSQRARLARQDAIFLLEGRTRFRPRMAAEGQKSDPRNSDAEPRARTETRAAFAYGGRRCESLANDARRRALAAAVGLHHGSQQRDGRRAAHRNHCRDMPCARRSFPLRRNSGGGKVARLAQGVGRRHAHALGAQTRRTARGGRARLHNRGAHAISAAVARWRAGGGLASRHRECDRHRRICNRLELRLPRTRAYGGDASQKRCLRTRIACANRRGACRGIRGIAFGEHFVFCPSASFRRGVVDVVRRRGNRALVWRGVFVGKGCPQPCLACNGLRRGFVQARNQGFVRLAHARGSAGRAARLARAQGE